jgi:DNA mismatch repair protein MutS2
MTLVPVLQLQHSSARVLEFDSLRGVLSGYASSPLGQGRIAAISPATDRSWIRNQQQLVLEIREFRRVGGRFEFSGLSDILAIVEKSRISGVAVEASEINEVIRLVDRAAN